MSGVAFESLETNFKTLFSRLSLANSFSTFFFIFICSFPEIHLFLINCNLIRFGKRLLTLLPIFARLLIVSTRFYFCNSCFY